MRDKRALTNSGRRYQLLPVLAIKPYLLSLKLISAMPLRSNSKDYSTPPSVKLHFMFQQV